MKFTAFAFIAAATACKKDYSWAYDGKGAKAKGTTKSSKDCWKSCGKKGLAEWNADNQGTNVCTCLPNCKVSNTGSVGPNACVLVQYKGAAACGGPLMIDVTTYGAVGDGSTDSTAYVQKAFDEAKDGSTVHFPKGTYIFGPVHFEKLKDVTIDFTDAKFETKQDSDNWDGCNKKDCEPWIQGSKCTGLTIKGGTFEGHNSYWVKALPENKEKQHNPRPYMMRFSDMTDFKAHDMTLLNSPHTHFKVATGKNVEIYNMNLKTEKNTENTDGIMLASVESGHVHDIHIQNGDDCLKANDGCKSVVFEHGSCSGSHGLSIGGGSESLAVQDITFRDFDLSDMSFGARIKFTHKTTGFVKGVTFDDLRMKDVARPLFIDTGYQSSKALLSSTETSPRLTLGDITYSKITAKGSIKSPGEFHCEDAAPCKALHLKNVQIETSAKWIATKAGGDTASVTPDASSIFDDTPSPGPSPDPSSRRRRKPVPTPSPTPSSRRRRRKQSVDIMV